MMTPKQLKILMIQHDVKPTDIAKRLAITDQTVWGVGNGYISSTRVEEAIAEVCGMQREDIFPIIPEPRRTRAA